MNKKHIDEIHTEIAENKCVVLMLSTEDCGVCTVIKPRLKAILEPYNNVKDIYSSIDIFPELSGEFMVFTVPTIILLVEGREVHRESRFIDFKRLEFEISRWNECIEST